MAIPATIEDFWKLVWNSGLVDHQLLTAHIQKLSADEKPPETPKELAERLIRDGLLTNFQARQLRHGKWQGFTLGKYRLLERLGEGGMGTVYLAAHVHMRRRVALKILPPDRVKETSALERFYREARAIAALDHPNIARAFDIDCDGKLHFLVMEFVDGSSLQDIVAKSGPLPVPRALHYLRQTALGLQHAHAAGLIHRDIKPSNLVVNAQGIVKILDLGVARFFTDQQDNLTKELDASAILGTADYIAPEQAMDSHNADIRADIYSLGCTGYQLLAGVPPFSEGSTAQKLIWHQVRSPRSLRELRPEVPEAVAAIIEKMMAKQVKERYQTPQEVADALQAFVPETAPPPSEAEMPQLCPAARESSVVDPHRMVTSRPDTGLLPVKSLPRARAAQTMSPRRRSAGASGEEAEDAGHQAAPPTKPLGRVTRIALSVAACLGLIVLAVGGFALLSKMFDFKPVASRPAPLPAPSSGNKQPAAPENKDAAEVRRFQGHSGNIVRVAVSPDGKVLATCGADKTVRLWGVRSGRELHCLEGHTDSIGYVAFSPSGSQVMSASSDKTLRLWDVATGKEVRQFVGHDAAIFGLAFAPDGKTIASGCHDKTLRIWDLATGNELRKITAPAPVHAIAFAPDGQHILAGGSENVLRWWNVASGTQDGVLEGSTGHVLTLAIAPDGRRALSAGQDKIGRLWDLTTLREIRQLQGHTEQIWFVAFSPWGGQALSAGSSDRTLRLWDLETGQQLYEFSGHSGNVSGGVFSPDGLFAFSSSHDRTARMWEIPRDKLRVPVDEVRRFVLAGEAVANAALAADGHRLLAGGGSGSVVLWNADTARVLQRFVGHTGPVNYVAFAADGSRIVSAGQDGTVRLWNCATGQMVQRFEGHRQPVRCAVFAPDGKQVLSCGDDKVARLWEVVSGQELRRFDGHTSGIRGAAFFPDGRRVITAGQDHTLRGWNVETGFELGQWAGHTDAVNSVAVAANGLWAVSGGDDKALHLWDAVAGKSVHVFKEHAEPISSVAVTGDGHFALSASKERTVRLWDLKQRRLVRTFSGHESAVTSVALSSNPRFGLSSSTDRTLRLWDLAGRDGLVGYWPLDDGGGDLAIDASGGGHHGSLKGNPTWVAGPNGGALNFDGKADAVDTGFKDQLDRWTIAVWVKGDAAPAKGAQNGVIHREKNFQIAWDHGQDSVRGATALAIGKQWHAARFGALQGDTWYHLAASFDGAALKAYTNGVLVATNRDPVGQADDERTSLKIGRHAAQDHYFRGTIGDVRVYNRALSEADVELLFLAGGSGGLSRP